jgi:hypothetical protein
MREGEWMEKRKRDEEEALTSLDHDEKRALWVMQVSLMATPELSMFMSKHT